MYVCVCACSVLSLQITSFDQPKWKISRIVKCFAFQCVQITLNCLNMTKHSLQRFRLVSFAMLFIIAIKVAVCVWIKMMIVLIWYTLQNFIRPCVDSPAVEFEPKRIKIHQNTDSKRVGEEARAKWHWLQNSSELEWRIRSIWGQTAQMMPPLPLLFRSCCHLDN